ncbi:MAG: hypothetical protein ISR91_05900 [Candidatus Delongbacteria bacterium]|nr:hypothetical protein [Candidatus Delongbacteria bacterium]
MILWRKVTPFAVLALLLAAAVTLLNCGGGGDVPISMRTKPISVMIFDTPPGADPAVSAELGGAGFEEIAESLGFSTNVGRSFGSPLAKKGGRFVQRFTEFPSTLRLEGKDSNSAVITAIGGLVYETLLGLDAETLEWTRNLASHWKISDDKMTFTYRISPDARWSDGRPVVAQDVVASWRLRVDEGILEPYSNTLFGRYTEPRVLSKYLVEVTTTELNWRHFLYFSSMTIMPAHHLDEISGAEYLEKYQFDMMPGTGPYVFVKDKMRKGKSLTLVRRTDWWQSGYEENVGNANFDEIKYVIIQDDRLTLEKFKKGELDYYIVSRAQWWVQEFDTADPAFDYLHRGLIQKRKIFNHRVKGIGGLAMNMRRAPFNDIRIRKAFQKLWNRELLMESLFFNEYEAMRSYYPGGQYEAPDLPVVHHDPGGAVELLRQAGWAERNSDGWLVKNGKIFELDMSIDQTVERIFTPFQEDLARVGIKLNLRYVTPQTMFKNVMNDRDYDIHYQNWTGLTFPNPESSFASSMADVGGTTNITGVKNDRIDEICAEYNVMYKASDRIAAIQEIDRILLDLTPYALGWYAPYTLRLAYWNKFGYPDSYIGYSGDWSSLPILWWFEPEQALRTEAAKKDNSLTFPHGTTDVYFDDIHPPRENSREAL